MQYTGQQKAALLREMLLEQAALDMGMNGGLGSAQNEVPQLAHEGPQTSLSKAERLMLKRIADRDGITEDEAASNLVSAALARRVKKRTGKAPARVYSMKRK